MPPKLWDQPIVLAYGILTALVIAITSLIVATGLFTIIIQPYAVPEGYTMTPTVEEGGLLRMSFRTIRRRSCPMDIERIIMKAGVETEEVVWHQRSRGGATPIGEYWLPIDVPLASHIKPGNYLYQTTIINRCQDGIFIEKTPIVRFEVVAKQQQ